MKTAKPVVTLDHWIGRQSCCMTEHRKSCDKEIKPYIRPKRQHKLLPDSWETKWICVRRYRNWKHRCKKKHQWEKHKQTPNEIKRVTGYFPEKYLLYLYGHKRWVEVDFEHQDQVQELIDKGKLKGVYSRYYRWGRSFGKEYLKYAYTPR